MQIIGNLADNPKTLTGTKVGDILKIRVAVNEGYGDNKKTTWYDCTVFDAELQKNVKAELAQGHAVAIEGDYSTRDYNGVTQHQIVVRRIGTIQFLKRSPYVPKGEQAAAEPAPAGDTSEYDQ